MRGILTLAALLTANPHGIFMMSPGGDQPKMQISRDGSRPAAPGPQAFFTGDVVVKPLFGPVGSSHSFAGHLTFGASARSAWHTHPGGQTLVVTSGTGWVQEWGGPRQQINPGDVIWTPPGVKHWHGASPAGEMSHIAIQEEVDGRFVDWLEKVSDEQYLA